MNETSIPKLQINENIKKNIKMLLAVKAFHQLSGSKEHDVCQKLVGW